MNIYNRHKKRIGLGAKTLKEYTIKEVERNFNYMLNSDITPTAHYVQATDPDEINISLTTKWINMIIKDKTLNDQKAYDEKIVLVEKGANVDVGCYFFWDNCYWIIIFKEHKSVDSSKKFIATKCNQMLNYKYEGQVYNIPVNIANLTMYSDGLAEYKYTNQEDAKRMFTYGSNPITRTIMPTTRVMITNKNVYKVTHMNDFEYNGSHTGARGIIKSLVLQTTLRDEDDLENNIAWNYQGEDNQANTEPLKIDGADSIMIGSTKTYAVEGMEPNMGWKIKYESKLESNQELVNTNITQEGKLKVTAINNVNYVGLKIFVQLIDLDTSYVYDEKEVRIRGFA